MNKLLNQMFNPISLASQVLKGNQLEQFKRIYSSGNPTQAINQLLTGMNSEQIKQAKSMMKNYGVPDDILNKF